MKIVLQDGIKDCGICSLLSVIRFFGGDVSKEYLREITNTTKNGVSAYNLIEGAKKLGFAAEGVSGDMTKIEDDNLPCLAHLFVGKGYKHFVVMYKIDKNSQKVVVMDPAKGKRVMSFSEFKLLSTNNFIFLHPTKKLPFLVNKHVVKKVIKSSIYKNRVLFIILIFLIISYFTFNILAAFHFKYLLEFVINFNVSTNIKTICVILFVIYILKSVSGLLKNILFMKVSSLIDEVITMKTFKQILLLPYLYYKNRTTGEVITRLKDLTNIKNFLIQFFSVLVTDLFSLIIFFILMFVINKTISLIVLGIFFVLFVFVLVRNKKKRKLYIRLCKSEEKTNSYLIESLNNVDTIKGGHIEKRLADKFLFIYKDLLEKSCLYMLFVEVNRFVKENIKDILLLIVYGMGSFLILENKMDMGDIFLFQSFLMYFLNSSTAIINLIDEYHNYSISLKRVEDLYTIPNEKFEGAFYYYGYNLEGDIVFKDLCYKYGSKKILNFVNLTIKKGEKILLVGESGSGKSSLVKILMRYLEVPYGNCSISGIDINHYHIENIRKNISYVSSNEFLFTDSLYNNLTLEKDVNEDLFSEVCRITKVDSIIKRRDSNYQMLVEEGGFNFSNGERQRIILCRYLLRQSNIYIFDEALGQIDIDNEKDILQEMFKFLADKTVIVISHRFNNRDLFDRVIKLENGKIYEEMV